MALVDRLASFLAGSRGIVLVAFFATAGTNASAVMVSAFVGFAEKMAIVAPNYDVTQRGLLASTMAVPLVVPVRVIKIATMANGAGIKGASGRMG
jgi:hypothetical protein